MEYKNTRELEIRIRILRISSSRVFSHKDVFQVGTLTKTAKEQRLTVNKPQSKKMTVLTLKST